MIALEGVRKEFSVRGRRVVALDGVSLTVPDGAIHGVVGHSGAGKSTLIRCLTGLERPTSGTVTIGDQPISDLHGEQLRNARRRIGMVFQHVNLLDSRTAAANVSLPLEMAGMPRARRKERVQELLDMVNLGDRGESYPAQLSGGEKQRVGIARALATEPEVLLFDEPTSALDAATTRQVLQLMRALRDRLGITVLVITHDANVVRQVCDSATLLAHGRVVETGSLDAVLRTGGSDLVKTLIPLPDSPATDARLLEVTFTSGAVSVNDVLALLAERELATDIVAGTIETIAGRPVGRLQLRAEPSAAEAVEETLRSLGTGVHVEVPR